MKRDVLGFLIGSSTKTVPVVISSFGKTLWKTIMAIKHAELREREGERECESMSERLSLHNKGLEGHRILVECTTGDRGLD